MLKLKQFITSLPGLLLTFVTAHADHSALVKDAWIADAPAIAKIRAAYLTLHNQGKHIVEIKSFSSPDFDKIELHKTLVTDSIVKMEKITQLPIKPGETLEFKPGGYHLMLYNPKRSLAKGNQVKIKMQLTDEGITEFSAIVRKRGENVQHNHKQQHHH